MRNYIIVLLVLASYLGNAQVKVGDEINSIDDFSILELESSDKALVLTRLTTAEMFAIRPLEGAMVYNIDEQCLHFFDGIVWLNLCDETPVSPLSVVDNVDGTFTYTNEAGVETVITVANVSNQTLATDNTPGQITISSGNSLIINTDDADANATNELQTVTSVDNTVTVVTDASNNIDLSVTPFDSSGLQTQIAQNANDIDVLDTEEVTQNANIAWSEHKYRYG